MGRGRIASPRSGPLPVTTFTTPSGKPASASSSPKTVTASGSCGAGFTTTVLPIASAGPTLPAMLTIGKLYGDARDHTDRLAEDGRADEPAGGQRYDGICEGGSGIVVGSSALHVAPQPLDAGGHLHHRGDPLGGARLGLHERDQVLHAVAQQVGCPVEQLRPLLGLRSGSTPGTRRPPPPSPAAPAPPDASGASPTICSVAGLTIPYGSRAPATRSPPISSR